MVDNGLMTMVDHGHMTMPDHVLLNGTTVFVHGQPWCLSMVDHGIVPWSTMVFDDHGQRLWCHSTKRVLPW
ncbi:hypothetical protein DPMN_098949 [Dreissena polymorpha]|uniref:Uncharacterized protein n=1 Tax=Dreissena polymorpha TaxID=45954 RepID=A0A9D4R6U2_DREPO|nr:hypothetical protein DPMN_098949 [Dreissena polymorpha]